MSSARTNSYVASIFNHIAEILEQQGENPFKIRAYRNAIRTLETLPEPVAEIAERGELRQIPGFGEAIAAKTQQILETGTCDLYERLKTEQAARHPAGDDEEPEPVEDESESEADMPAPW